MVCGGDSGVSDFGGVHGVERIEKAPPQKRGGAFSVQVFGTWFMGVSMVHYSRTENVGVNLYL